MRIYAVIEITPGLNGDLPSELVDAGYRASSNGVVMFALNGVASNQIDKLLDPVIREVGTDCHGVVYASLHDDAVLTAARTARAVVAVSSAFREMVRVAGLTSVAWQSVAACKFEDLNPSSVHTIGVRLAS